MDVMQAIKDRRSVRKYKPDPVSDEALNTVLDAARWAPSWSNTQCSQFIVVRDPETKKRLAGALTLIAPGVENPSAEAIRSAPVVVVACAQLGKSGYYHGQQSTSKGDWHMFDVALAMQNLTLAAHSIGLGTVHIGLFDDKAMAEVLDVPEGITVVELTPLGYPDEAPNAPPRKDIADFMFREKYGAK